eukprot:1161900-Pelagomonas_calceolata.AAC.15
MQTAVPPISHSNRGRGEGGCKQTESAKPTREHGAVGFVGLVDFVADDIQRAASFAACDIQRAAATSKGLVRKHPSTQQTIAIVVSYSYGWVADPPRPPRRLFGRMGIP